MLRMKKVLKGIIRGLDHIVNFIALSLILAAMFLSGYMLWDSHQVYQTGCVLPARRTEYCHNECKDLTRTRR